MLQKQKTYKPFGQIVSETGDVERLFLEECLSDQRVDVLSKVVLFSCLPREALIKLASALKTVALPSGECVYHAEEPSDIYYVVASGSVTLSRNENGMNITVAVRGTGEGFGEISLLTGRAHSTTAVTMERTCLILIPRATFIQYIFSNPAAAQKCAAVIAELLGHGYDQIVDASVKGEAYRHFISEELHHDEQLLIGNSPVVMKLLRQIEPLTVTKGPVLVQGGPGTEMRAVAGLLHMMSRGEKDLLLEMDAKSAGSAQDDNDPLFAEMDQSGTLFGRGLKALPFAPDRRPGLLTLAQNGMVVIENIEHLGRRVQESLADMLDQGWYRAIGEQQPLPSTARIVATSTEDLTALVAAGKFDHRLHELLAAHTVTVPPLRQRKRDLRIIVDELIRQNNRRLNKQVRGIAEEAYQSLMTYNWPGNTEELSLVIRRAVSISRTDMLTKENLFIGPPPVTGKFTLNLLQFEPVRWYVQHRLFPVAFLSISAPFIILITLLGLFGSQAPERNAVLVLTFGIWEPLVVVSTFFVSRLWCSVCPVGFINRSLGRRFGLNLKTPQFLKDYGAYIAGSAIAAIFWTEAASDMLRSPRATAILVLSIVGLGVLFGMVFKRKTWCRYICGLGGMVGTLSTCSAVELRANYSVCNNTCKNHECNTGTEQEEGCPMCPGPFSLSSNQHCVMCGSCIKTCPLQSPVLNLRLPAYDLCAQNAPDKAVATLAIFLIGSQLFRGVWFSGLSTWFTYDAVVMWVGSFILMGLSVLLAGLFAKTAARAVFEVSENSPDDRTSRMVYALLPLSFSFEVAFQLNRFLIMSGQLLPVLGRQLGIDAELPGGSVSILTVRILQVLLVAAGTAGSMGVLAHQREHSADAVSEPMIRQRFWPVLLLAAVYLAALMGAVQ